MCNLYLQGKHNTAQTGHSHSVVKRYVDGGSTTGATKTVHKAISLLTGKTISQSGVVLKSGAQTINKGNKYKFIV